MNTAIRSLILPIFAVGLAGNLYAQTLTDMGATAPSPGTNDISQLSTNGNTAWPNKPDNLNYYTDNNPAPGQTFTTGTNAMNLVSVAIKTGGLDAGGGYGTPATTPAYYLNIFSMSGGTATLLATFSAANPGFTDGDWLQWSGLNVSLATNTTYAYSFGRQPSGGGYAAMAVATNAYAGGEMALIPTNGGAITTGSSHTFDAVFDLGLQPTPTNILTDIGTANPASGPNDLSQLSTSGNAHLTGTFNYFTDNGNPPGQTFTTGTRPVVLNTLSLRTGSSPLDANAAGLGPQAYQLRIFSVSGSTATLVTTYTSPSTFSYTDGDWLRWANLAVPLAANATYAYTFHRVTSGYGGLAVASGNLYTNGAAALIPSAGGTITFESSGTYDGVFVVGLSTNSSQLLVGTPVVSGAGTGYIGAPITVSSAAIGNLPISYQWQSGGASGSLTNVPNATNATLIVTPPNTGTYRYDYIATDSSGGITSGVATATIIVGTPMISPNNTVYLGSPITLTSPSGAGNPLLGYQWQSGGASGSLTNVPNATNVNFTVTPPGTGNFQFDYILNNGFGNFTSSVVTVTVLAPITVTLNTTQTMATMPLEGLGVASAVYDNILTSAGTGNSISNAGINIIRYPGGSYADTFHWQNYTACNGSYLASGNTFDNWINNTVIPAGAKAIITVNYGSNLTCDGGTDPTEAAAWVDYANNTRKLGIKYWEIGNEVGGNGYYGGSGWEYDLHYPYDGNRNLQPALSPAAYGSNSLVIINAMKAKDPTIKCGIGFDQGRVSYNAAALPPVSNVLDFVIIHWYPGGTDAQQLQSCLQIPGGVSDCRSQISQYIGSRSNQVGIAVTETGSGVLGGGSAEYAADTLLTWIENGAFNVDYQELHSGFLASGTPGIANNSLMGPAYGAKMARQLAAVGDTMLKITSSTTAVHVHATSRQDGKTGIMLINTDPLIPIAVTVNISGPALASSGIWYQFGQTNFIGANNYPSYPISSNNVAGLGNTFTVTVPAYTIVNLLIPPAQTNTPPLFAAINNQTINVGANFQFTASATDTDLPPQTLTYTLLNGPGSATLNTNTGAFSWRPFVADANTTNPITLKVADNGSPSMSATQTFTVTVNPLTLPSVSSATFNNGQFTLRVTNSIVGPDYAVQASTNLVDWSTLFITNSPAYSFEWTDTNTATLPAQFYRIKLGPPLP
jgi:hypothetical protein